MWGKWLQQSITHFDCLFMWFLLFLLVCFVLNKYSTFWCDDDLFISFVAKIVCAVGFICDYFLMEQKHVAMDTCTCTHSTCTMCLFELFYSFGGWSLCCQFQWAVCVSEMSELTIRNNLLVYILYEVETQAATSFILESVFVVTVHSRSFVISQ